MSALYLLGVAACAAGGTLWGQGRPLRRLAGAALATGGVLIIYVALHHVWWPLPVLVRKERTCMATHTAATAEEARAALERADDGDTIVALSVEAAALARRSNRYVFVEGPATPRPAAPLPQRRPRNRWVM